MNQQKCIYLSEEDLQILKTLRQEQGLKSDSQVFSYLLKKSTQDRDELAGAVRRELEQNYLPKERIRFGVQTAEQNSTVLLDAMNTLLHMLNAKDCIPVEVAPHPVITQSRAAVKKQIAKAKQRKDERKSKRGWGSHEAVDHAGGHK